MGLKRKAKSTTDVRYCSYCGGVVRVDYRVVDCPLCEGNSSLCPQSELEDGIAAIEDFKRIEAEAGGAG